MLKILAHRGVWSRQEKKNTFAAYQTAVQRGYGLEIDVRDSGKDLIVSHDAFADPTFRFEECRELLQSSTTSQVWAINIKADGLAGYLSRVLSDWQIPRDRYFFFDMSVPDTRGYLSLGLPVFTRLSEVEREIAYLEQASGVWVDAFDGQWYTAKDLTDLASRGKQLAIVSPELHGRDYVECWQIVKDLLAQIPAAEVLLCTDKPDEAASCFLS